MESKPQQGLIRIAYFDGQLTVDQAGRAKGRGVYLCKDGECQKKAKKRRAIQRNFDGQITDAQIDRIFQEVADE